MMIQNFYKVLIFQFLVAGSTLVGGQHLQLSELASEAKLEVTGSIQTVDVKRMEWDLLLDAKSPHFPQRSVRVRARSGDFAIYPLGASVQGQLQAKGDAFLLSAIWPNAANAQGIVYSVNHQLRMDTTARGHYPFRAIGEYLPAFALYNQRGLVTQSSNLQGSYVVMNFIFTRCMVARMCPLSTQKMRTLAGLLSEASNLPVRLLSVTLDPEYDTPGVFEEYARAYEFSAGSIDFLTGPQQAVSDLKAQLGVLAKADDKLIINHTMMVIVADPLGKISYQVPGSAWSPDAVFEHIQQQAATAQDAKFD